MKLPIKSLITAGCLAVAFSAFAQNWPMWEKFKAVNVDASYRVIDHSDARAVTTSEGQSYALFFALTANDREVFDKVLDWTEKNLARGDISKTLPAWLWGRKSGNVWGVLDDNNATDSDLWIAYCLLEAARLWNVPEYAVKARAMMTLLKRDVRDVPDMGKVLLPGGTGFDHNGTLTLNPSYYPIFVLRRLVLEDPYWKEVLDGSLRSLIRSAPAGFAPDWVKFDPAGKMLTPKGEDYELGSYNAIRTYLWTGMLSKKDHARSVLMHHYDPMVKTTIATNLPLEKVNILTGKGNRAGNAGFAACILPMLSDSSAARKTAAWIRTLIANEPIEQKSYYRNVLMLFGTGFDAGLFAFDADGHLLLAQEDLQFTVPVNGSDGDSEHSSPKNVRPDIPVVDQTSTQQTQPDVAIAAPVPVEVPATSQPQAIEITTQAKEVVSQRDTQQPSINSVPSDSKQGDHP